MRGERRRREAQPESIQRRVRRPMILAVIPAVLLVMIALFMLALYSRQYTALLHNVTAASEFSRNFKADIDGKMDCYVSENQASGGLPVDEVEAAQALARELLDTTAQEDSRRSISGVVELCRELEEELYLLRDTDSYDERQLRLEQNIYVLTARIQEQMCDYLYGESVRLGALQSRIAGQIVAEILLVCVLTVGLVALLLRRSLRVGRSIARPIEALCGRVEDISRGDLAPREPIQSDSYELVTLSRGIEEMAGRLNDLMRESTQKQASLRKAELALLQAQINPHFLYNTMDTIIWLIEAGQSQAAEEMVANLSAFFRNCLSKGEDVISLETEEQQVLSYLQIQQVRYRDILQYTIDIDPALRDARLPKLTLQPLVENALYHGIKLKRSAGHISVTGRMEGDDILLQVTDDGVGMAPERLRQLERAMDQGERVGFGLVTVHERLRLYFGPDYGLSITSREGAGTTVTARIPYQTGKEGSSPASF